MGKRLENRHHGSNVRANEHGAGGFHGHGHHQGPPFAGGCKGLLDALSAALICRTS